MTLMQWSDHDRSISVHTPEPFRYEQCLGYLARNRNECLHTIRDDHIFKAVKLQNELLLLKIGSTNDRTIDIEFVNKIPGPSIRAEAAAYVSEWFDLTTKLKSFYEKAAHDPLLHQVIRDHYGLRLVGINDLFEAICWAVIGQQINLDFAYTLKKRFVESFGEKLDFDDSEHWLFPGPGQIASITPEALAPLQFTRKKAEYIVDIAKMMNEGHLSKEHLLALPFAEAVERLVQIRGIGPWTAHYILMRCLRAREAFPISDVGLHNALKHQLKWDRKPSLEEIREMAAPWSGWEAYATFYLWRSLY